MNRRIRKAQANGQDFKACWLIADRLLRQPQYTHTYASATRVRHYLFQAYLRGQHLWV